MADEKPQELLIIKRSRGNREEGHGGAWKIAFADFMTAMMALFLVLWLISATNQKTKASLARYFNPVKLVDMTVQKRGLSDPNKHPTKEDLGNAPPAPAKAPTSKDGTGAPKGGGESHRKPPTAYLPTHSEAALFRDPYAILAQIEAKAKPAEAKKPKHENIGASASFQDPFRTVAPQIPNPTPPKTGAQGMATSGTPSSSTAPSAPSKPVAFARPEHPRFSVAAAPAQKVETKPPAKPATTGSASSSKAASSSAPSPSQSQVAKMEAAPPASNSSAATPAAKAAVAPAPPAKEGAKLQAAEPAKATAKAPSKQVPHESVKEAHKAPSTAALEAAHLRQKFASLTGKSAAPKIEVKPTKEGVLISLTDAYDYAMFAIGSAEPQPRTVVIMKKIAHVLSKEKGSIVIVGHTDARRYKSGHYDNWRLSTDRAQMALYMLVRGGVDEKRITKIEGASDHDLKNPKDPYAAENRRIEILLREKP